MTTIPKFKHKLRNAIILSLLLPMILMGSLSGIFFFYIAKKAMEDEMGRRLITIATLASIQAKDWGFTILAPGDESTRTYSVLTAKLKKLAQTTSVKKVYIFDGSDQSIADSDGNFPIGAVYYNHTLHQREITTVKQGHPVTSILFKGEDGNYYKSGFAPIFNQKNEIIGFIGVEGSADFFSSLAKVKQNTLIFLLIGILVTVSVGFFLSGQIVSPIRELVTVAKNIGDGKMETPVAIKTKNEIGFLAHSINEMRENIIERDTRLRAMMHGIAHEVRNPLGGIELFAGLLREDLKNDFEKIHYVSKIENEIKNLKNVVEEFLDFARSVKPIPTKVDMREFTNELKLNFLNDLKDKEIMLKIKLPKNSLEFFFDPDQIRRALLNILKNSIDATPAGGKIEIECSSSNNHSTISIKDTGIGIKKDDLTQIFEPFFTTKENGSGLGLSFARKIVNSHRGEIGVVSSEGKGTSVTIILPRLNDLNSL